MNAIDERPKEALLPDLLPYEAWDPHAGVIWLKDGSVTQTFEVMPRNPAGLLEDELLNIQSGLAASLNQVSDGTFVQFLLVRERSKVDSDLAVTRWKRTHEAGNTTAGVGPLHTLLEAKKAMVFGLCEAGALFRSRLYVTLRIPSELHSKVIGKFGPFSQIAFRRQKPRKFKEPAECTQELTDLSNQLRTALEGLGFETRSVDARERLALAYRFLNPARAEAIPFEMKDDLPISDLSERLALTDLMETQEGLKLGRTPIRVGTLKALPDSSVPCLAHFLSGLPECFAYVITMLMLPQTAERERLSRKQRLAQGMASGNRVRNLFAETQLQEIEETLSAMVSSGDKLAAVSFHVLAMGEEEANDARFSSLISRLEGMGAGCQWFEESVGAFPVFFGTLPFAPCFMPRPKRMLTSHLGDFLPLYGIPPGHEQAEILFESPSGSMLGYSLFEKSPSANAIVIGSTGSGKSTLASGLILGMVAGNAEDAPATFVIDVGNSFKRSLRYLGGSSLDLSPEAGTRINPFDLPPGVTSPDPEKIKFLTAFFDEILGDQGSLPKLERALLETEILRFYESRQARDLSRFKEHLDHCAAAELKRLAKLLELWCEPHPYGLLFDGETNVALAAPHLHFELKGCQRYPDLLRVAMLVVMDVIWRQVRGRFPKRSLIVIDEAHTLIRPAADGRSNSSARWVEDCFRQMRKFASAAIAISQTAKDLKSDEIGDGILANAPNRFILRQRGDETTLREDLKLNNEEVKAVFSLSQVRGAYSEFYLHSESIRGVLAYRPTPLELWLSTTHPPDLGLLESERAAHPEWSLPQLMEHMAKTYPEGSA